MNKIPISIRRRVFKDTPIVYRFVSHNIRYTYAFDVGRGKVQEVYTLNYNNGNPRKIVQRYAT